MELADTEIVGVEALRTVGNLLYGESRVLEHSIGPHAVGDVLYHEVHRGMVTELEEDHERILLHFPGLERSDLSLRSEDGLLYVGVNGREHAIPTTSPAKSTQVKAKLENDVLRLEVPVDE